MRYVFLAYGNQEELGKMAADEQAALMEACEASDEALRQSGRLLAVEGLQGSASTVRLQDGAVTVDEGPLVPSREALLGIFSVNARDLNAALQIASQMPQLRGGPIEVLPVWEG